jgi:predicted RND superfamily exporter protein
MGGVFEAVLKRRVWVFALVALLSALLFPGISDLRIGYSVESFLRTDVPKLKQALAHYEEFPLPDNLCFFAWPEEDPFSPRALDRLERVEARMRKIPGVSRTMTMLSVPGIPKKPQAMRAYLQHSKMFRGIFVSQKPQKSAVAGFLQLHATARNNKDRRRVIQGLHRVGQEEGVSLRLVGIPVLRDFYVAQVRKDQLLFLPLGAVLTSLLLILLVGSLRLAFSVLFLVPLTLGWTFGLLGSLGAELTLFTSTLPTLLMVVSVADGVHLALRFRSKKAKGLSPQAAALQALRETVFPCFLTSLTTAIGFGSLAFAEIPDLRDFGAFACLGVGIAFLLTVVFLPCLLTFFCGRPVEKETGPNRVSSSVEKVFGMLTDYLLRLPAKPVLFGAGLLCLLAVFYASRVEENSFMSEDLWENSQILQSVGWFEDRFIGVSPGEILVVPKKGHSLKDPLLQRELRHFLDEVEAFPGVTRTLSYVDALEDGMPSSYLPLLEREPLALLGPRLKKARVLVFLLDIGAKEVDRYQERVRLLGAEAQSFKASAVGLQVLANHQVTTLMSEVQESFFFAFVLICLLLILVFRGLRFGLIGILPNLFPLLIALGFMGVMGIRLRIVVVITFAISFGLAVDNTIHILSRFREERKVGKDVESALHDSLRVVAEAVFFTSALLLLGFSLTLFSGFRATYDFGRLACITILAALLGDLIILPALLRVNRRKGPRGRPTNRAR